MDKHPLSEEDMSRISDYLTRFVGGNIRRRRIRSIRVLMSWKGKPSVTIEVGKKYDALERDMPLEQVLAIFESDSFLVVTESRGNLSGPPLYFVRENVRQVVEFDD